MKHQAFIAATFLILAVIGTAWGHGTSDTPETLTGLSDASILHRLKQLGYTGVQVIHTNLESADVTLQRDGKQYKATVSRSLIGPSSIAVVNAAEVVERMLRPMNSPDLNDLAPVIEHRESPSKVPR